MIHSPVLMEKIMSKTNDTTKTRELTEAELAAVSGGLAYTFGTVFVESVKAPRDSHSGQMNG
jgi:bacteriocin-like protein